MRASSVVPERGAPIRKMRRSCISEGFRELLDRDARESVVLDAERAIRPGAEVLEGRLEGELDYLAVGEVPSQVRELLVGDVVGRDRHHLRIRERRALAWRVARVLGVAL